jgi:hypothetical protein
MLRGYVWALGGLAIVIGGVGMMNAQLMSVAERTRANWCAAPGWGKLRPMDDLDGVDGRQPGERFGSGDRHRSVQLLSPIHLDGRA